MISHLPLRRTALKTEKRPSAWKLETLWKNGKTIKYMAQKYRVSTDKIKTWAKEYGVEFKRELKKKTRSQLVKELDDLSREIVYAYFGKKCVVCGSVENMTPGHVFSRTNYSTRWEVEIPGNILPQCRNCNMRHEYDPQPFMRWYIGEYGLQAWDDLYAGWNRTTHYKTGELERMVTEYKAKLQDVKNGASL